MDAPSNTKSAGLRFAEQHMQRHGWTEGKGLGKREDGRSEAIKVKVKCDTAGVGHNSAEQFTFHWWDHVFNKTASSISVEPDQDGVKVKKLSENDCAVSSKKPRKAMLNRNMLYGRFIKSATLTSGGEKPMESSSSDTSDSSEDEDSKLDLSSATKVSDEDLMKICGGRTAHKGARHGLTMSAKLLRIEEQERAFMDKYGKKETKLNLPKSTPEVVSTEELNGEDERRNKKKQKEGKVHEGNNNPSDSKVPKKKKKKQKKGDSEESVEDLPNGHDQEHVPSTEEDMGTSKKKKSKVPDTAELEVLGDHKNIFSLEEENSRPAKKKKKRKTESEESSMFNGHTEDSKEKEYKKYENAGEKSKKWKIESEESSMLNGHIEVTNVKAGGKSKRRKKKRTEDNEDLVKAEEHTAGSEEDQTRKPKSKKWKVDEENEENDPSTEEEEERSRRKKKKLLEKEEEPKDEDAKANKKKKKLKDKDRRD